MPDITASLVKELRDATSVSMMECKRALVQTEGNIEEATKLLREKGVAVNTKRAAKETNCGIIASSGTDNGKCSTLVEVNCETDFTAKNDDFQAFVKDLSAKMLNCEGSIAEDENTQGALLDIVAAIGEKIVIKREIKYTIDGIGCVTPYIHLGGKVGVLVELACGKEETISNDSFKELAKDITLHIAAANPGYLTSDEIPADIIAEERAIYAKQVEGKPAEILEKILDGKIGKFCQERCLLDQMFVKDTDKSITQLLEEKGKELDDTLTIKRFVRYQIGG